MTGRRGATEFDDVAPNASAMIESMRAHGYTLASAVADLIDNSIAAQARNIWLQFEWDGDDSWISVTDDGNGMSENDLVNAMRLGSQSPLEERDADDLGRFGLGLKTASFSQARRLTLITRPAHGERFLRRWDLDHLAKPEVQGWQLLRSPHPETGDRASQLDALELERGTQVLLEVLDRVIGGQSEKQRDKDRENHFLWEIDRVRMHLAMVFHRFLEKKRNRLRIELDGEPIRPWSPFIENHAATQVIGSYAQKLGDHAVPVRAKGYVLPHRDRFSAPDEHKAAGGPKGWNAQQGFYVYRGDRLIIAGDWLQLRWQKEEHFKLARICVDFPNSMDHEWQIDVKKSTAAPPAVLREWLRGLAQEVRKVAKEVYAHRGKYGRKKKPSKGYARPWVTVNRAGGEFSYRIDRKHAVLAPLIRSLSDTRKDELETLLRLIEETVPVQQIWINTADNQEGAALPFAGEKSGKLREHIQRCHVSMMRLDGIAAEVAWDALAAFDGFQTKDAQAIIAQLRGDDR